MNVRRLRMAALGALVAGAIIAVPAATASAATAPIVGGGSFARTIPFIDGWVYAYECHAFAPGAVSTSVDSCSLMYLYTAGSAPPSTSSGPAVATTGGVSTNPANLYRVCWSVSARYPDASTQSTSGCSSPPSSIAGAGAS
ncbi:MAG TPA: hypothetical protein VGY97_03365 [Solirubrobacteraceae bacterium]|nr:hypothetical protein [Solirubrobacteraceae bacterium]